MFFLPLFERFLKCASIVPFGSAGQDPIGRKRDRVRSVRGYSAFQEWKPWNFM
jgi:hypothetical protein